MSMEKNFSSKDHEVLVFVDSDDGNIVPFLLEQKKVFPNLKIIKNKFSFPIAYQENMNYMFREASGEIVSYLQSDMVVGPNYDQEVVKHLQKNMILSSTRIEPPLHPPGPEKFTMDFGKDPNQFRNDP